MIVGLHKVNPQDTGNAAEASALFLVLAALGDFLLEQMRWSSFWATL